MTWDEQAERAEQEERRADLGQELRDRLVELLNKGAVNTRGVKVLVDSYDWQVKAVMEERHDS